MYWMISALVAWLGAFTLLNEIGECFLPGFSANRCWIDLGRLPPGLAHGFLCITSLVLLSFAFRPPNRPFWRGARALWVAGVLAITLLNGIQVWWLCGTGRIGLGFPLPFSMLVAALLLAALVVERGRNPSRESCWRSWALGLAFALSAVGFPLAQMFCFGKTDYRRPADAVVVFGARVYADGRCSDALADRVRTGCSLYLDGIVPKIVFSGGPGDGSVHECEAMRRMALKLGVADQDMILDPGGLNTKATVRNSRALFPSPATPRLLTVTHFYHLPRVKLQYQRVGCEVFTVPAQEQYTLTVMPYLMLREIAAFWAYYLFPGT